MKRIAALAGFERESKHVQTQHEAFKVFFQILQCSRTDSVLSLLGSIAEATHWSWFFQKRLFHFLIAFAFSWSLLTFAGLVAKKIHDLTALLFNFTNQSLKNTKKWIGKSRVTLADFGINVAGGTHSISEPCCKAKGVFQSSGQPSQPEKPYSCCCDCRGVWSPIFLTVGSLMA